MEWVKITDPATGWSNLLGGGSSVTATLTKGVARFSSVPLTLALSAGAILVSWSVQRSPKGMNTWTTIATGLTDLEYEATGLDSSSDYDFQGIDVVSTTSTTTNVVAVATTEQSVRVIQYTSSYPAAYTDGLFQDQEPIESGIGDVPVIAAPGRTILSNFNNLSPPAKNTGRNIYGVRFLLGNMSLQPILGGEMIVGLSVGWNGYWTPRIGGVTQNVVTGNLMTGWQRVSISGDTSLPIPAAEARASGMPLTCVWTDWLTIPAGWSLTQNGWDFLTRFLLPPRSAAPYALTRGEWDPSVTYSRNSVLAGRSQARIRSWAAGGIQAFPEYHLRAEGDYVTDPTVLANITTVAGQCPPSGVDFVDHSYGPPGIGHTPLLAIEYALDPTGGQ
jgi:hypothetical protein